MAVEPAEKERIGRALTQLNGLWGAERAVMDLLEIGHPAAPQLREFAAARDPSGIFLPRCEAVGVLGALGAKEVLLELLSHPRDVTNPIEQTGEDAVLNACAQCLEKWPDEEVFRYLLAAGRRKPLAGIVQALGNYARFEAIPVYDAALAEDFSRPAAEDAFRKLGPAAMQQLINLSKLRLPAENAESELNKRRRRSTLKLLAEFPNIGEYLEPLRILTVDSDPAVAALACSICRSDGLQ